MAKDSVESLHSEPDKAFHPTIQPEAEIIEALPSTLNFPSSATVPPLERAARQLQRTRGTQARRTTFSSLQRRFGNGYATSLARQLNQLTSPSAAAYVARDTTAEEASAIADCQKIAPGWMRTMLKDLAALPQDHLTTMQKVTDDGKVAGIDKARLSAALDAVLAKKTGNPLKSTTLDWLAENSIAHSDQVIDIKNTVGLATFEPAFVKIVQFLGNSILLVRLPYNISTNLTTVATDAKGTADPHTDNENRRKMTVSTYQATKPFLDPLKDITKDRPARYKCENQSVEDAILAALQLEIVFNAENTLASPDNARADSATAVGMDKSIEWCGAFVAKSYLESEVVDKMKVGFPSTERLEAFFHYDQYIGNEPMWVLDEGDWKQLQEYHHKRGSERKWIDDKTIFANGKSGTLDIRPGDVVLLDNNPNKRAEVEVEVADDKDPTKKKKVTKTYKYDEIPAGGTIKRVIEGEKADHVQMVQSWNPATRELFVIEGNSSGYIIDTDSAHPAIAGESEADRKKREEIEAATGKKLTKGKDFSHVAVGMNDLADQPDPSKLKAGRSARVYGIGRLSIVDFENQTYDNSPKNKKPKPPKAKATK
jgi:hypothetical protein